MGNIIKYLTISATVGLTALGLMSNVCAMEIDDIIDEGNGKQIVFKYDDSNFVMYRFYDDNVPTYYDYVLNADNETYRLYFCDDSACYDANNNYNVNIYTVIGNDGTNDTYGWSSVSSGENDYVSNSIPNTPEDFNTAGDVSMYPRPSNLDLPYYDTMSSNPQNDDPVDPGNNDPVDPTPSSDLSISSVFSNVTGIVTGVVTGALGVLTTMWANPIGQVIILSGLAATVIGFGLSIVTRKRKMK